MTDKAISLNDQTAKDMLEARARSHIHTQRIKEFLHGGHDAWEEHSSVVSLLSTNPVFDKNERLYLSRTERYERSFMLVNELQSMKEHHAWSPSQYTKASNLLDEPIAMDLHETAFAPVFLAQGSPELLAKYSDLIVNRGILGCYLQTELGHGSNVAGLETTATYIPETQEFELHSPTLTSRKWWVGALARTATHGVVQAQLILPGGKAVGPHLFFVQLRSLDDHKVLPGITLGDIGPKAMSGFPAVDNGFASFDRVHIPREHMLSKFAQVTKSGEYVQPPHAKMSYGGMVYIRAQIASRAGWNIAKAATISIRYATVRRQGNRGSDGLEQQIISYPSVYNRLLPILSRAYVFILLGHNLVETFTSMSAKLSAGDTSVLAEMHAITSSLKVLTTSTSVQDIEIARRALGGHGYSAFAGLGRIYADNLPSVTYEGDNFVLDQQVARAAVKAYNTFISKPEAESNLSPSTQYLRTLGDIRSTIPATSWTDPQVLVNLLERRAAKAVQHHVKHLDNPDAGANQRVSRAVGEAFVAAQTLNSIGTIPAVLSKPELDAVTSLLILYLLTTVEAALVDLYQFGLIQSGSEDMDPASEIRATIKDICARVLLHSIALTDSFGFSDWELDSALGVHDGRVYEALWNKAQTEPLNKSELPPGYFNYLKPILDRGQRLASKNKSKL
ncbi:hypothetical protein QCA50_012422 [Cerrena zonata]|uniref:Acyl-coenzyme A oxidase n=1 Tax=Cerrena zonata TaxID=2478898 RepID=A0AAW0G652_9APHY